MNALSDIDKDKTDCGLPPASPAARSIQLAACMVCAVLLMMLQPARAALLLYEPFSTTAFPTDDTKLGRVSGQWNLGNNTDAFDGWSMVRSSAALSYSSLVTSNGSRGVARIANTYAASRNIGAPWTTAVTTGSVYCSFLVNVATAPQTNRTLLVLSFFASGNISGRNDGCGAVVWLNRDRQLQVGKYNTSAMAPGTTPALDLGVTYLVVLKYTFNPAAGDDEVALYLDPVTADPEPGSPTISTTAGTDSSQMKSVWLPQGQSPEFGSYTGEVLMDEIRVGDAWADVLPNDGQAPPTVREPVFTNIVLSGSNVILRGSNGVPQGAYQMLRSSDVSQPVGSWSGIGIKTFDANGNFNFTNTPSADAAGFYRLLVLSTGPVYPPGITSQPQAVAIGVGQNATFNVTATGTAPLTYFWYFNTNTLLTGGASPMLTITNAQVADSGKISVTVSNLLGVTNSAYATLLVTNVPVYPPVITLPPQDLAIAVGQNATLSVTASGTAPLTYLWYYNTNTLLASGPNATLTVTNAQLSDAGRYSVTVTNLYGSTNSVFATLTVTNSSQPPFIVTQPASANVSVGQTASFTVTATGALPLHYQWYFNTNTVLAGQTNSALTLTNVQLANAGNYSVTITNLFGATNSAFATLTVNSNASPELIGWAAVAGYGQTTTTGGGTNTPILATNLAHLRSLAGDGTPRVILLSGTYTTGSTPVEIANNKTLRGVDTFATIQGGININTKSNIIVQNLNIQANGAGASPVDAAASRTSHHLWFDHVTFSDAGDGLLDLTIGSDFITVSWCKFFYTDPNNTHRLCSLVGNSSTATNTDTGKNNVTYHHNWFAELVDQRMPRLLFGKGHMFNNFYNSPGNGYCIGTGSWGSALVENNYFKQVNSPHQSQDGNPSYIAASGNVYDTCTGNTHTGLLNPDYDGNDPGPWTPSYSYTLDAAADVPTIVTQGAGPQ